MFHKTKTEIELLRREIKKLREEVRRPNHEFEALKRMLKFASQENAYRLYGFEDLARGSSFKPHSPDGYSIQLPDGTKVETRATPQTNITTDYKTEIIPTPKPEPKKK